jgi:signal transduction histidine kinase
VSTPADDPHWQRPAPSGPQQRWDVLVGVLLAGAILGNMLLGYSAGAIPDEWRPGLPECVLWSLAVGLPLALRRRFPLGTMLACSAAYIGMQARYVPESQLASICLFIAIFTAGAWGKDRLLTRAARGIVIAVMFAWLAYSLSATAWGAALLHDSDRGGGPLPRATAAVISIAAVNVLYFAAAWVFGDLAWNQRRQQILLQQRNDELAVERDRGARRAVIAERVRIARELHDVVAHHVSLMGLQAAAARRVLDRDPELTRSTLTEVESTGRSAMEEMHRLLGVLRQDDADAEPELSPAPGLADLEALVGSAAGSGLQAAFAEVGTREAVPESLQVTVYRIVQEAITNTLRHGAATRIDVRLRHLGGALEVEIVDDGRATGSAGSHRAGPGMGHVGMRERTALHGGELELGPRSEGGYRVRARFPLAPVPVS